MKKFPFRKIERGFTLIEIVLVVAIIMIVSGAGYLAVNQLNNTQNFEVAVNNFVNVIYEAKSNALSQVKLGNNCAATDLMGYKISISSEELPSTYSLSIVCGSDINDSSTWTDTLLKTETFPENVSVSLDSVDNFTFTVPHALVEEAVEINLGNGNLINTVTVSTTGAIFHD